ncbi:methyl-accepting chemotaxis protein [Brenneria goodwinii]|uniref:methyl-accepting chemotaxis protein n=1 Tax=Brenneria goodwinii TaxID=1109412 RepID=UPI0036E35C9C
MRLLRNITIRKVLLTILALFLLLWGGVSWMAISSLGQVSQLLETSQLQKKNTSIMSHGVESYFRTAVRLFMVADLYQSGDKENARNMLKTAMDVIDISQNDLTLFQSQPQVGVSPELVNDIVQHWTSIIREMRNMAALLEQEDVEQYRYAVRTTLPPISIAFGKATEDYAERLLANDETNSRQIHQLVKVCQRVLIAALILGLLILFLTDRYLVSCLLAPLEQIKRQFQTLSSGQLHHAITDFGRNNIGQLIPYLRDMQESLIRTVTIIRDSATSIYQGSGEISAGNSDLSSRTEQQASALEETAASMEQLGATVKLNTDNVTQANKLAQEASSLANKGGHLVDDVVVTMSDITASSQKIADITSVINGIAFQTNILALNAAVEAARAGEQGRGFAVVAGEVRNLAQRSAQAAKEIGALIAESVERIKNGSRQVALAGETMTGIVQSVTHVTNLMGEIASASEEQSRGIGQVAQAVTEMDSVTQQNAALVQESAAAAASLEEQARQLTESVAVFQLPGNGAVSAPRPAHSAAASPSQTLLVDKAARASKHSDHNWKTF